MAYRREGIRCARGWIGGIIAAPAIPHTRTGKKLEIPVKRILQGGDPSQVMDAGAVDNPDALQWFAAYQTRTSIR